MTPLLFVGGDVSEAEIDPFRRLRNVEVVQSHEFGRQKSRGRRLMAMLSGQDYAATKSFRRHGVDVVFESATFYGWRLSIPAIAWFPDFQHRHMPYLFSTFRYWKRDLGFRAQVLSGRAIMVSSESARRDCENFYPSSKGRTSVVRFAVTIDPEQLALDPSDVARGYNLPERFFYLPNQFWRHKNHRVVIEALHLLKQKRHEIVVAASGDPRDPRHPRHYEALRSLVATLDLEHNVRFLGFVPHAHVVALMRASVAIINPSLFEGWSTTVEEAKTVGVPMLLSNLAVHREQAERIADFFDPYSARQLADQLARYERLSSARGSGSKPKGYLESDVRRFAHGFSETVERAARQMVSVR